MEYVKTLDDLRRAAKAVNSGVAGDTIFGAKALLFIAERMVAIEARLVAVAAVAPKKRRAPSRWNRFFAAGMKDGKTPAQIGAEWKARKGL